MENTTIKMHVLDSIKTVNEGKEIGLRAFAEVLGCPATRLYAKAKTPIAGQVYDPSVTNWDALNEYFLTKLAEEKPVAKDMDELVKLAVEKEAWLKENKPVRATAGSNLIEVDGVKIPKRKASIFEMGSEQESLLCFKHDPAVYKMVYQTQSHTAIREVKPNGEFAKDDVRVISNGTLNTKCVPPTSMKKAIEERFSGAYTEATETAESKESAEPVEDKTTAPAPQAHMIKKH